MDSFAEHGLVAATTADVAARAGVSQPYVVRLFGTKQTLVLAAIGACFERVADTFRDAAAAAEDVGTPERLGAMGAAYAALLEDRRTLRLQLAAYSAAADDPEIGDAVRSGYAELVGLVHDLSGATGDDLMRFFAQGMLLNVIAATDLGKVAEGHEALRGLMAAALGDEPGRADATR